MREVKNEIKILSVDRESSKYLMFSAKGGASTKQTKEAEAGGGGGVGPNTVNTMEEVVRLRSKPPVITEMWQPNSYTKVSTRHAHAMHTPCTHHAHAVHMPCTCHAHAMHMVTEMCQPLLYANPPRHPQALFKGAGHDKEQAHAKEECYAVLRGYIETRRRPCACHAHAHAHAMHMHMPCTCHAHAMRMPCACTCACTCTGSVLGTAF